MSPECSAASACGANPKQIAATHPQRDNIFRTPLSKQAARPYKFHRGNMHLSARSELKIELADSRIETKLPTNEVGLLHVCLNDVSRFTCGRPEMPLMRNAITTPAHWDCAAWIGLTTYGTKRPSIGNLPSRPKILSLKTRCLTWRPCVTRSPIISKII